MRAEERYGLKLTASDIRAIEERAASQVKRGIAIRLSETRSLCTIEWAPDTVLEAVWSKKHKKVITFLPDPIAR